MSLTSVCTTMITVKRPIARQRDIMFWDAMSYESRSYFVQLHSAMSYLASYTVLHAKRPRGTFPTKQRPPTYDVCQFLSFGGWPSHVLALKLIRLVTSREVMGPYRTLCVCPSVILLRR
ncbi:hypothetical protein NPIL_80271 [Nephila pilipes]|uniref:Uncharacterized protein n=1 Tax=Nephila pilipes TaxID=299642 RepID=A0A8X6PRW9_NEPPI|nr:hypothetical protein NPIL_80271 [Nephila pilipes]